jgi:hypothetical protein
MAQPISSVWGVRPGPEHNYIDGRTHVHHVHLFNQVTGGEHNVDLLLGCAKCRECGRPYEQSDLGDLDPAKEVNNQLSILQQNHAALMKYAGNHGVPINLGPLASIIPQGHRVTAHLGSRMLHSPRQSAAVGAK